eukprot:3480490-Amphidinium_carterae.4
MSQFAKCVVSLKGKGDLASKQKEIRSLPTSENDISMSGTRDQMDSAEMIPIHAGRGCSSRVTYGRGTC